MIFALLARFLKSYTRFDVKISFLSVFCFRYTYYEPRATKNRPIGAQNGLCGGGGGHMEIVDGHMETPDGRENRSAVEG